MSQGHVPFNSQISVEDTAECQNLFIIDGVDICLKQYAYYTLAILEIPVPINTIPGLNGEDARALDIASKETRKVPTLL